MNLNKEERVHEVENSPKQWKLCRLKYIADVSISSVDRHEKQDERMVKICHYPEAYKHEYIDKKTILPFGTCTDLEFQKFALQKYDVLLTKDSETSNDIGVPSYISDSLDNTVFGYHLAAVRIFSRVCTAEYLFRYIQSSPVNSYFSISAKGITRYGLKKSLIQDMSVLLPKVREQKLISTYIRNSVKKIDGLVTRCQKKIELLKEQRKSLISQCVTKGLDPSVEMEDSGVEWIGEIPNHWNAVKLKYLTTHNDENLPNNTDVDYRFYYLQIGDVSYLEKVTVSEKTTFGDSPASARRIVKYGDVIVSTVRINLRSITIIPRINNLICSTAFCVLRSNQRLLVPKFLEYSVGSDLFVNLAITKSTGVAYPTISARELVEIEIAVPPIGEQEQIAEYLDSKIEQYNKLIALEAKRIGLLEEYRQSLISSAVTGKIRITEDMI